MNNEPDAFSALLEARRITVECGKFVVDAQKIKQRKLLDLMRRVIANPENAKEVANEIAIDWTPMIQVNSNGSMEIIVGSGRKR